MEKSSKVAVEEGKTFPKAPTNPPTPSMDIPSALAFLKEPQTISKISCILSQNGISTTSPTLRLDIEGISDNVMLELDPKDVAELFSKFGPVDTVMVPPSQKSTAIITMTDFVAAYLAQQILNTQYMPAYQARIFVKWNYEETAAPADSLVMQRSASTYSQLRAEQLEPHKNPFAAANVYQELGRTNKNVPNAKYTCKFDIQIESDKDFNVIRKLSGAKCCNLRRIVDLCSRGSMQEVIKLRLRGKGSELSDWKKQEKSEKPSEEPLSLCITSKYYDKYLLARHLAKELILNVYEDYKRFCDRTGKEPVVSLQIKMTESISGIRSPTVVPEMKRAESVPVRSGGRVGESMQFA